MFTHAPSFSSSRYHSFRRSRHSGNAVRAPLPEVKKLNIILSLDGVLLASPFSTLEKADQRPLLYFLRKSALFFTKSPRTLPRCVLPGTIELIQLLYSPEIAPWINISVFNRSSREDARASFAEILTMALGKERSEQAMLFIKICGYTDCDQVPSEHLLLLSTLYGLETSLTSYQKDIYKLVGKEDGNNTLLLDANPDSIRYRQAKNYCAASFVDLQSFEPCSQEPERADDASHPIFQQLNSVYYIASRLIEFIGLFKRLQEQVPQLKITTVAEALFQSHFESRPSSFFALLRRSTPRFEKNFGDQHHYTTGLSVLKQFNSELTFITPSKIESTIEKPMTEGERAILEKKRPVLLREPAPAYSETTSKLVM